MYCRVFACDFDGTGASNGRLAPEVASVLAAARAAGYATLLVTGRVLEELQRAAVEFGSFDAVVAENGAVVWFPAAQRTIQLGPPPPDDFLGELRAQRVSYQAGAVVVGTWDRHANEVLALVRRFGMASQLVFNREAMMVLPAGVDKASGIRRALAELHRSERNTLAFGDAENDRSMFESVELAVAARGSVPSIAAIADEKLSLPGAAGVAHRIQAVLYAGGYVDTPARHRIAIGTDERGEAVFLPSSGTDIMVSGDPRSGKSWLAGLVAERLIERGYRLCVVDPEGDYVPLGQHPGVLVLGTDVPLPDPDAVASLVRDVPLSLVLTLAGLTPEEKQRYVARALPGIEAARDVTGMPHWILLDEAHYFLHDEVPRPRCADRTSGNYLYATYRPSLVATAVHERVAAHLVMRTTVEEERYFLTTLLQKRWPEHASIADALGQIADRRAALLLERDGAVEWRVFTPDPRVAQQTHHGRKYADTKLPVDKAFRFLEADGTLPARSVVEFCEALEVVPLASLRHHLLAGDFSRWAGEVLGDARLAALLRKLEHTTRFGAPPSRDELLAYVRSRYLI